MRWLALILICLAAPVAAVDCKDMRHNDNRYSICTVDLTQDDLRLFLYDNTRAPYGDFSTLENGAGVVLSFGMNAGMYHEDRSPVGHYLENGVEEMRVIPNAGPGNFGMLPNGVFCIGKDRADVYETRAYIKKRKAGLNCTYATQSGPMLVIDGELHPRFIPDSTWRYLRNGVGTSADGKTAYFAISNHSVTFHDFGSLFKDALKTPNALYFDGNISRLYAPELGRNDYGRTMGPIVGVVAPN